MITGSQINHSVYFGKLGFGDLERFFFGTLGMGLIVFPPISVLHVLLVGRGEELQIPPSSTFASTTPRGDNKLKNRTISRPVLLLLEGFGGYVEAFDFVTDVTQVLSRTNTANCPLLFVFPMLAVHMAVRDLLFGCFAYLDDLPFEVEVEAHQGMVEV